MEKKMYAVLFEVNGIIDGEFDCSFNPISLIEGMYNEETGVFTDELGIERFIYISPEFLTNEEKYVIGELATRRELKEQFPELTTANELKKAYFNWIEQATYYGKYNSLTGLVDIVYKSNLDFEEDKSECLDEFIFSVEYCIKEKFTLLTEVDFDLIKSIDNIEEMKEFLTDLTLDKEEYIKGYNQYKIRVLLKDEYIFKLFDCNKDIDEIKKIMNEIYDYTKSNIEQESKEIEQETELFSEQYFDTYTQSYKSIVDAKTKQETLGVLEKMLEFCKKSREKVQELKELPEMAKKFTDSMVLLNTYIAAITKIMAFENLEEMKQRYYDLYNKTLEYLNSSKIEFEGVFSKEEENTKVLTDNTQLNSDMDNMIKKVDESMSKLNQMIGLEKVKDQLKTFKNLKIYESIASKFIKNDKNRVNMVFYGNPGTGKTTVARLLGEIFYALGYTKTAKVTECTATDLIGEYVGHTGPKTKKLFDANRGGIIFIDEAYGLVSKGNTSFSNDAIVELLKEFEKGEIIFILAGYPDEMKEFIDSNPGLKNRINYYFDYENYTVEQLYEIFEQKINNMKKEDSEIGYILDDSIKEEIMAIIKMSSRKKYFSNGRYIDNLVKVILSIHANRIIENKLFSKDDILTIKKEDITGESINNLDIKQKAITWGIY